MMTKKPTLLISQFSKSIKEFEEKVVLLTEKALYICSYNYSLEKVVQFQKLDLGKITCIQMGEYILSSLTPASRSEDQNYGIILSYSTEGELVRWNTGSIRNQSLGDLNIEHNNALAADHNNGSSSDESNQDIVTHDASITFKAVRYNVLGELDGEVTSCKQQITDMVHAITKATGRSENDQHFIIQKPIIR